MVSYVYRKFFADFFIYLYQTICDIHCNGLELFSCQSIDTVQKSCVKRIFLSLISNFKKN
jgi:hypothetical protein